MDRFLLKRTAPETDLAGTSRPVRLRQDHASNIGTTTIADINLDELPFDPANQKRISQYTKNPKKQDEIRRIYLLEDLIGQKKALYIRRRPSEDSKEDSSQNGLKIIIG